MQLGPIKRRISIFIPVVIPLPFEEVLQRRVLATLSELPRLQPFLEIESGIAARAIARIQLLKSVPRRVINIHLRRAPYRAVRQQICLKFSATFILQDDPDRELNSDGGDPLKVGEIWHEVAAYEFLNTLKLFFVAVNIARPGCFINDYGLIEVDGRRFLEVDPLFHSVAEIADFVAEKSWPGLHDLDMPKTWSWACRQKGFAHGLSETRVGRALNAFSYLFGSTLKDVDGRMILWSMMGLEALFTEGTAEISTQLMEKSRRLLKMPQSKKKAVRKLYDLRSRLLHGQRNLTNKYGEEDEILSTHRSDGYHAELLAGAMLVSALQLIAQKDWGELQFTKVYRVAGS